MIRLHWRSRETAATMLLWIIASFFFISMFLGTTPEPGWWAIFWWMVGGGCFFICAAISNDSEDYDRSAVLKDTFARGGICSFILSLAVYGEKVFGGNALWMGIETSCVLYTIAMIGLTARQLKR